MTGRPIVNDIELKKMEDLGRYITILIVDDEIEIRDTYQRALKQDGYESVWTVEKAEHALEYLSKTNILLADYGLATSQFNGIELVRRAKKEYGDRIQTIVFSAREDEYELIKNETKNANAAAFFMKPVRLEYIKLWIKELGKRIWIQQILDNDPDEVLIRTEDGTILFVSEEKERIFKKDGKKLLGDKCYLRFEIGDSPNQLCKRCPSRLALEESRNSGKVCKVRTEWDYITRGDIQQHKIHQENQSVELVTAPLFDIQKKPRAIIEIARDITIHKTAETIIDEMEKQSDWNKRKILFMDGFNKLGIPRVRLYLHDKRIDKHLFRLLDYRGVYDEKFNPKMSFDLKNDKATQLVIDNKKPLIFKKIKENHDIDYTPDTIIKNIIWVGKNKINYSDEIKKDEWIDIPLIAGSDIIGKVTIDGWDDNDRPDSYDLEILSRYCASAGQIIYNARIRRDIEQRATIEKAILEISKKITHLIRREELLFEAVQLSCDTMNIMTCSIFIYDKDKGKLIRIQSYGKNINGIPINNYPDEIYSFGEAVTGKMFERGKAEYRNDLSDLIDKARTSDVNPENNELIPSLSIADDYKNIIGQGLYNCIFAPLIVGDEKIGLLRGMNKTKSNDFNEFYFDDHDLEMFELLAGQIAVAIYNARLFDKTVEAEKIAREARDRFKVLFDKSPDGIVIIDPTKSIENWPIEDCNKVFMEMNGYSERDELVDQDIDLVNFYETSSQPQTYQINLNIAKYRIEERRKYYQQLKQGPIMVEVRHRRKDGTIFNIQASSCLVTLNGQERVLGIDRDITESKRLYEIAKTVAHLTVVGNFEETLNKVVQGTVEKLGCDVVVLYTYDEVMKQLRHPPTYAGHLNFPDKIRVKKIVELNSIVYMVLNNKDTFIVPNTVENENFRNTRFTKEESIRSLIAIPLSVKEKKVGVMFINYRSTHQFIDDELKNIELFADQASVAICNAQLFEYTAKVERQLRARTALAVTEMVGTRLLHEAGGKVNSIKMAINCLEKCNKNDATVEQYLRDIKVIVDDYNAIARRIKPESLTVTTQPIRVNEELRKCCVHFQENAKSLKIDFLYQFNSEDDELWTNPTLFNEVVDHLVSNAIKAMSHDSANKKLLTIVTENINNKIDIHVIDTGPSIPLEYTDKLFLELIEKKEGEPGFGIGCALAGLFVEAFNGSIKIENNIPGHVEIVMRLPRNRPVLINEFSSTLIK